MKNILTSAALLFIALATATNLEARATPTCTTTAVTPPPTGYVCNQRGSVKSPNTIATTTAANAVACRDLCLGNQPTCLSYSYGPGKTCTTYKQKILQSAFQRSSTSKKTFWNRHCFGKKCGLCPTGQTACQGQCKDLSSDVDNCGSCGNECVEGQSCKAGSCECPQGELFCGGQCVDPQSDKYNCSKCGVVCPARAVCYGGGCFCPANTKICNGVCADTTADYRNCGDCGNTCAEGSYCENSQCVVDTSPDCDPSNTSCGKNTGCVCARDGNGKYLCVLNYCGNPQCYYDSDCGDNFCLKVPGCNGFGCMEANQYDGYCSDATSPTRIFRRRF